MALRHTSNQIHLFISRCQFAAVRGDQYHLLSTQAVSNQYKHLYYQYDLISGKVNQVDYSPGQRDEYHHRYTYDADNRIVQVETSKDAILWDKDANYEYYKHGPLSRAELGDLKVQGLDYAYTIQGWIKGVNSNTMSAVRDPGRDGDLSLGGNSHAKVATDAFGYTLGYFAGDYNPIGTFTTASKFEASTAGSDLLAARSDLWNGNISHMVTCLPKASDYAANQTITPEAFGSAYQYDQLNRLSSSRVFTNINTTTNQWQSGAGTNPSAYATDYTYDAMGNILTQKRNGGGTSATALDELTYNYHTTTDGLVSNRLYQVNDVVSAGNYSDDIDDQGTFNNTHSTIETANNYGYDELGNLVRDVQEEIASIEWTVYGKMKKITRNSSSSKADLEFGYDASGNRLWKKVTPKGSGAVISTYYYLRDAQGNEMCRYVKYTNTSSQLMYVAQEHSIYGSSRVGVDGRKDTLYKAGSYSLAWGGVSTSRRELGLKSFELANHLGNVLVTVSDKPVYKVSSTTIFFQPEITSISDYYPFGTPINGRSFSSTEYRFGFNGKELDEESETQDYGMRINDCRLGRFLSVDPLVETTMQPYSAFNNNPIRYNDPTGMIAEDPGDIYSSDGKYLKNDGIDDKKVYVVDKSKIVTTEDGTRKWANNDQIEIKGVDHTDFLNRANWVYGEGGGNFTDHYAHTIQNLKEHGVWGPANKPFASDEAMFKSKMTHKNSSGKIVNMYPGYFDGTDGNVNSKAFANLRKDLYKLTSNEGMRASISSVIGSMMGTTQDPVNGAYQWVGGAGSQGGIAKNPTLNNATNVTNVTSGTGNGQRYHTFYSLLNE